MLFWTLGVVHRRVIFEINELLEEHLLFALKVSIDFCFGSILELVELVSPRL